MTSKFQLVKEPSDKQEALQALCHQQNPTDPRAGLPEGQTEGKVHRVSTNER